MARANRHYNSGFVWHITHRCHKNEFLLRFAQDRQQLAAMAFRREEAVRDMYIKLLGDFKPYIHPRHRWPEGRGDFAEYAVDSWKKEPGV